MTGLPSLDSVLFGILMAGGIYILFVFRTGADGLVPGVPSFIEFGAILGVILSYHALLSYYRSKAET